MNGPRILCQHAYPVTDPSGPARCRRRAVVALVRTGAVAFSCSWHEQEDLAHLGGARVPLAVYLQQQVRS